MKTPPIKPDWKWGTPEGSREFDRILDRQMTFRQKLEWLEEMETLALRMQRSRVSENGPPSGGTIRQPGGSTAPR